METAPKLRIILKQYENSRERRGVRRAISDSGTRLAKLKVAKGVVSRIETGSVMCVGEREKLVPGGPAASAAAPAAAESRALVALAPRARASEAPALYRQAPFLAHLLAVKDQHAQTRVRRRVAPQEAIAAYRATAALAGD
jgi:hypothetical protein